VFGLDLSSSGVSATSSGILAVIIEVIITIIDIFYGIHPKADLSESSAYFPTSLVHIHEDMCGVVNVGRKYTVTRNTYVIPLARGI